MCAHNLINKMRMKKAAPQSGAVDTSVCFARQQKGEQAVVGPGVYYAFASGQTLHLPDITAAQQMSTNTVL